MDYADLILATRTRLCLAGTVCTRIWLFEALAAGAVPVILVDEYVLPFHDVINWESISISLPENRVTDVVQVLHDVPYTLGGAAEDRYGRVRTVLSSKQAVLHNTFMILRDRVAAAVETRGDVCERNSR